MKSQFDNLTSMERRFVVGVFLVVFLALNLWFVIPHFGDWKTVTGNLTRERDKLKLYNGEKSRQSALDREIKSLEGDNSAVPEDDQAVEFARNIQNQASQAGVMIENALRIQSETNQFFLEQRQTIQFAANDKELVDFLFNLGSGNSTVRARGLDLRPDPPRQQLKGSVTMVASYQKKAPAKPATKPATATTIKK